MALSLALQNLLTYSVNMMDTVMLGRYSQNAMSGVSLCNQMQFMLQMLVEGAGEGAVVLGAQYWGKNKLEPIPHIIGSALRFGGGMAVLMFLVVLLAPEQLLSLLSNEPLVIAEGVRYFRIISFSYIIFTVTNILVASLRSIGIVTLGYVISFSTLCINVYLNYLLIYGNFGFPELGVRGAAIATLVSRCVELLIVVYYLKFREKQLCLTLKKLVFIDTSYVRDYMQVSFPVLINQAQWGAAHMLHRVLKRAGLPKVRFHDLRHTFATLALQNGVDIKTVSGMLGHFSAGFTLDTYAHVTTAAQKEAANTMEKVLANANI